MYGADLRRLCADRMLTGVSCDGYAASATIRVTGGIRESFWVSRRDRWS